MKQQVNTAHRAEGGFSSFIDRSAPHGVRCYFYPGDGSDPIEYEVMSVTTVAGDFTRKPAVTAGRQCKTVDAVPAAVLALEGYNLRSVKKSANETLLENPRILPADSIGPPGYLVEIVRSGYGDFRDAITVGLGYREGGYLITVFHVCLETYSNGDVCAADGVLGVRSYGG